MAVPELQLQEAPHKHTSGTSDTWTSPTAGVRQPWQPHSRRRFSQVKFAGCAECPSLSACWLECCAATMITPQHAAHLHVWQALRPCVRMAAATPADATSAVWPLLENMKQLEEGRAVLLRADRLAHPDVVAPDGIR
eukprot:330852-Chlamydomonas_euryale.AAC.3